MMFSDNKKAPRFVSIMKEEASGGGTTRIFVDTVTGIQYFFVYGMGSAGGLTVLIDRDGKPIIHEDYLGKENR